MKASTLLRYTFLISTIFFLIGSILKVQHLKQAYPVLMIGMMFYFIYAILALREIWLSIRVDKGVKITWTLAFILMTLVTGFFYYVLGRKHVANRIY